MERAREFSQQITNSGKNLIFSRLRDLIDSEDFDLNYEIIGKENISCGRELIADGKILIAALDHRSYADMATGAFVAISEGFDDLVKNANIIVKISYVKDFPTNLLPQYFNIWPVVPHTMPNYPNREEINKAAISKAQNLADGSILVITPEGARSGEASMQSARHGSERFWHGRGERYILPIAIEGTEKQWPRKIGLVAGFMYYAWFGRLKASRFIFGEPVAVSKIDNLAQRLSGDDVSKLSTLRTDLAMGEIARLHLASGDPKYAGRYADIGKFLQKSPLHKVS